MKITKKPDANELSNSGGTVKSLWAQRQILVIEKDILYQPWKDQKGTTYQAFVPVSGRQVLTYCHDHPTADHLGIRKTLSQIRISFYWPGLQRDARHYVSACEKCLKSKNPVETLKAPMHIVGAGRPMERIAAYILGELPVTERGNRYILVVSDYFTKWTKSFPIPNIKAKTVANTIVKEVIQDLVSHPQYIRIREGNFRASCSLKCARCCTYRRHEQHHIIRSRMEW